MPTKCSVRGCDNFYTRGKSFFDVPSPLKYKFSVEKAALSRKRRKRWLEAMRMSVDISEVLRICDRHFVEGKPAALEHYRDVDWVPSLNMNLPDLPQDKKSKSMSGNKVKGKKHIQKYFHPVENRKNNTNRRVDLKKFLNYKVAPEGNLHSSTFSGTNGSGLAISQKHGYFTFSDVTLKETALNGVVLRVHLMRDDLNNLKRKYKPQVSLTSNKRKRREQQVSSFGRELKKKSYCLDYNEEQHQKSYMTKQSESLDNRAVKSRTFSFPNNTEVNLPVKNKSVDRNMSLHSKLQDKSISARNAFLNIKTLNRTIKKIDKDKIKVKFFPRINSTPVRKTNHVSVPEPLQLRREILFVKQYKNEHSWKTQDKSYYLKFPYFRYLTDGKLHYPFQKLITDIKHMNLPGPSWKIKVIIRQGKISAITFTNKLSLDRSVSFSANNDNYVIIIDNRPAMLIGSPNSVRSAAELETLLEIVQNIDPKDPMIFYK